MKKDHCT